MSSVALLRIIDSGPHRNAVVLSERSGRTQRFGDEATSPVKTCTEHDGQVHVMLSWCVQLCSSSLNSEVSRDRAPAISVRGSHRRPRPRRSGGHDDSVIPASDAVPAAVSRLRSAVKR